MVVAWRWQGNMAPRLAQCIEQTVTLRLTSAFPYAGNVRLFPMPRGLRINGEQEILAGKDRKRIKWVSEGVFKRLLAYGDLSKEMNLGANFAQAGKVWLLQEEITQIRKQIGQPINALRFWEHTTNPRVTLDRVTNASNFFETAQLRFAEACGLWFAAKGQVDWAEEALKQLQDSGIGGMRSVGHGAFTHCKEDVADWSDAGDYAVLLSRYVPTSEQEMQSALYAPASAFSLATVGGWCNDDAGKAWRRKHLRLVEEGSLVGKGAVGQLVDVKPDDVMDRPVYRSGIAFAHTVEPQAVMA
jgi:CRISPR-associated protein Csm4